MALLAVIQGITEFLPVSSSAHLILPAQLLGWPDQGLLFDVAVHAGTLCAVMFYFRHTLASLIASLAPGAGAHRSELWALTIATVPVLVAGLVLKDVIATEARSIGVITAATLGFGVLLGIADRVSNRAGAARDKVSYRDALLIGMAQVFALIPGTSRSGVTITAALFLGYHPAAASRFSFLLSMPVIAGALLVMLLSWETSAGSASAEVILGAFVIAAVFAYATIKSFMYLLQRVGLMPFVVYRLILGMLLLGWMLNGG